MRGIGHKFFFDGAQVEVGLTPIEAVTAGGVDYTLALDFTSFSLNGQTSTLTASLSSIFDHSVFSFTGQTASLTANLSTIFDHAVFNFTGQNADLLNTDNGVLVPIVRVQWRPRRR